MGRVFAITVFLMVAACQAPQPTITDSSDSTLRIQYNGGERYEAVLAAAKAGCATYNKQPVLIGTRCLEAICFNKEALFRCE